MLRKLAFLAVVPLWASFAAAQATVTNAGGSVSQGSSLVVANSIISSPPGTLAFTCPLTAFAQGANSQIWSCAGGTFTLQSTDGTLSVSATFDSGSRLTLTASGGGIGGRPINYSYRLTANITGTVTQNGQTQSTTGTTVQSYSSVGTRLDLTNGVGTIGSGTTTINNVTPPPPPPPPPPPALTVMCAPAVTAVVGTGYNSTVTATGGVGSITYSLTVAPPGMTINSTSGLITWTPTASGPFNYTAQVQDSSTTPVTATTSGCSITVTTPPPPPPPPALTVMCAPAVTGVVGTAYNSTVTETGGVPPITYSLTGTPPAGITVNPASGNIMWTPTAVGTYSYTVQAKDSSTTPVTATTSGCSIKVTAPPPPPPPAHRLAVKCASDSGKVGKPYSSPIEVRGGVSPFTITFSGNLPTGLAPDASGLITGTPTAAGTFDYQVTVVDKAGTSATRSCSIKVNIPRGDGEDEMDLFYPKLPLNSDGFTGIGLSDLSSNAASLVFRAFDRTGVEILGKNAPAPASRIVASGAQLPIIDDQLFSAGISEAALPGWGRIASSTSKLAGFFLTFNGSLTSMDGADISQNPMPLSVLPEIGNQDYTRILLANPNSNDASVTIDLVRSDGTVRSTVDASIKANGTFSGDLQTNVFPGIVPDPSDYVWVTSDQGLLHYESFGKISGDIAVLAGQDPFAGASTLYSPQYVVGGPWRSALSIVNLDPDPGSVTLRLVGDDGVQIGETQRMAIAGGGKIYVSDQSFFGSSSASSPGQLIQGYVEVTASGMRLSGSVVFGDANRETFSTSMPLLSTLQQSMVLSQVASNDTYFTGVAIVNPNDSSVTATIDLYNSDGILLNTAEQVIQAGQRKSQLLTGYFPELAGQDLHSGYIKVTADKGVACFGVFGTHNLSVLSAIPASSIQ